MTSIDRGQVSACGHAEHADARRVDAELGGPRAQDAHGALRVFKRRAHRPAVRWQTVIQHHTRGAAGGEPSRHRLAAARDLNAEVAATACDQHGAAIGIARVVNLDARLRDVGHRADAAAIAADLFRATGRGLAQHLGGPQRNHGRGGVLRRGRSAEHETQQNPASHPSLVHRLSPQVWRVTGV